MMTWIVKWVMWIVGTLAWTSSAKVDNARWTSFWKKVGDVAAEWRANGARKESLTAPLTEVGRHREQGVRSGPDVQMEKDMYSPVFHCGGRIGRNSDGVLCKSYTEAIPDQLH
ncbi:hypothetical protein PIB30_078578 [Stylosanthes scabra]|uniref:Secreted protein n=1 Tax=Stylosanthes scabra TaxID=79078 RepID=A0ABU6WP66_9FABA|nr:hypothetical protein [Stylosanthes scabra]